jgi:hypothetical protein
MLKYSLRRQLGTMQIVWKIYKRNKNKITRINKIIVKKNRIINKNKSKQKSNPTYY